MQRDEQLSCKHFAAWACVWTMPGSEGFSALQATHELTREQPHYHSIAQIWRTSLAQSEVVRGETAAVDLPPAAAVKARVSRFFSEVGAVNSNRDLRGEVR